MFLSIENKFTLNDILLLIKNKFPLDDILTLDDILNKKFYINNGILYYIINKNIYIIDIENTYIEKINIIDDSLDINIINDIVEIDNNIVLLTTHDYIYIYNNKGDRILYIYIEYNDYLTYITHSENNIWIQSSSNIINYTKYWNFIESFKLYNDILIKANNTNMDIVLSFLSKFQLSDDLSYYFFNRNILYNIFKFNKIITIYNSKNNIIYEPINLCDYEDIVVNNTKYYYYKENKIIIYTKNSFFILTINFNNNINITT